MAIFLSLDEKCWRQQPRLLFDSPLQIICYYPPKKIEMCKVQRTIQKKEAFLVMVLFKLLILFSDCGKIYFTLSLSRHF
jgi:hypothetical protein